ncbi:L-threonylcarbamoyladenylate synthase [Jannaschia seohaensis]|uniref:Threonylcarbamoyl-AMP synthase n=1 Tax=Jannaschia seohaensis TaxID=475081 RepID=A0A2Y9B8B9_9RHOB|nr:L-threonylcarbamoyladenylate synthase [Jannaschia seohaensis]PWJ10328.1 L-threonylcarbamoyladenylate synthase [Jannaschia seohaensis]SSA51728.1 L-threonylcarbamoyladenylate synthase [Jannaschia seohaensis]
MASTETRRHGGAPVSLDVAAEMLRAGRIVAFPTETVYGLGALATDGQAVARVFEAKGRPSFNPLIVHVCDQEAARALAVFDADAEALAARFWPGPLTLVLPLREGHGLSPLVTAGLDTVGLRVPAAPIARDLLKRVGAPIAAPSANLSGRLSPTRAAHVAEGVGPRIDGWVDGGVCAVGLESTILRTQPLALLREGGVTAEEIEAVLGRPLPRDLTPGRVQAPGQLSSHYAPGLPVRLDVTEPSADAVLVGFGPVAGDLTLSASGDLREAAAALFDTLHQAELRARALGRGRIDVAPIPERGLGRAIADRLRRAAAPRP